MKIKRALLSCSDKTGIIELAKVLKKHGAEIYSSGGTLKTLMDAGISTFPVEKISGSPEAFQGRMKTLSFPIFGGILARRGDLMDEADLKSLNIQEIDAVIVNFYPFEKAAPEASKEERIELIDIGGPALVRAAAKNSKNVLILTDPAQYPKIIAELDEAGKISESTRTGMAALAWDRVLEYDQAIAAVFGTESTTPLKALRYGENPHQKGFVEVDSDSPINWNESLTPAALSYNNILDLSSAYLLATELKAEFPKHSSAVIVKHNNPCGVSCVPSGDSTSSELEIAWSGDPISAFGGVIVLTEPLNERHVKFLEGKFIELLAAPDLDPKSALFQSFSAKRKGLKAVNIRRFESPRNLQKVSIPGGTLVQEWDTGLSEKLEVKSAVGTLSKEKETLARFGILVCRSLKSNAIAIVHSLKPELYFLAGAGQGQPNRIDALKLLAVPRAKETLSHYKEKIEDSILVSDAFFPFRDSIDATADSGLRTVVQPGGSIRDPEVIKAAKDREITLYFTGTRHFKH